MEKEQKLTKKDESFENLNSHYFNTTHGKMTIPMLTKRFGVPHGIMEYAKIEAKTGMTERPFIVVERFVGGKLVFSADIIIKISSITMMRMFDVNGIEVVYILKPDYDTMKMVKATKQDISKWQKSVLSKVHE